MSGVWTAPPKFRACIADCDVAVGLTPSYIKALFRRAKAHLALASAPHATPGSAQQSADLDAALGDLRAILAIEADHKEATRWLHAAPRLVHGFNGRRLPETPAELARELAKLDGAPLAAKAATLSPPDPSVEIHAKSARRDQVMLLQVAAGGALVLVLLWALGLLEPLLGATGQFEQDAPISASAGVALATGSPAIAQLKVSAAWLANATKAIAPRLEQTAGKVRAWVDAVRRGGK